MNAKDRVMRRQDIKNYVFGDKVWELLKEQLEAQDEISFKMGYNQALKDIKAGFSPSDMV